MSERVSVIVLAKETQLAKTRLTLERTKGQRIARALAATTVRKAMAARSVGDVYVVTSDRHIATDAEAARAYVVPEGTPLGMNRAAALGRSHAIGASPDSAIAIVVADLPYLDPDDVDDVIDEFREGRRPLFVADHHGVGTTLLIHDSDNQMGIAFGRGSAHMHQRLGYEPARRSLRGLRVDLDTPEDLKLVTTTTTQLHSELTRISSGSAAPFGVSPGMRTPARH
ncbi:putative 2-phospho-L-lactate guanylyltransferase [metagenome]|uniref:Putative 2-phospho-L-lactate guanylyltransferase n=1 Tax=metagenome TaxID=256318 RepID=A0A2P2C8Q9_9ZZZZ